MIADELLRLAHPDQGGESVGPEPVSGGRAEAHRLVLAERADRHRRLLQLVAVEGAGACAARRLRLGLGGVATPSEITFMRNVFTVLLSMGGIRLIAGSCGGTPR
jgi:hypothetical protein